MYIAHHQYSPVQFFYCSIWNHTDEMILITIFFIKIMKYTLYNELIFYLYIEDEFLPIW